MQSWFYVPVGNRSLIYAIDWSALSWSISTEWFFYFLYPGLALIVLRARRPWLTIFGAGLWCVLWTTLSTGLYDCSGQIDAWAVGHFGPIAGAAEHPQDSFVRWLLYFSPYLRIGEFVLGCFTAQLYVQLRERKIGAWENRVGSAAFFAAAASVLVVTFVEYSPEVGMNVFRKMSQNFALAPSAAALIFCAARYRNLASQLLNSRHAIMLGDASYSIYLLHFGVLKIVGWLAGSHGALIDVVELAATMAAIIVISLLLYAGFEAPARRWLRRWWLDRVAPPRSSARVARSKLAS